MRLTVLGCSGSVPGPTGPSSSYLLEQDGFRLLLDHGSGAFGALQRHADPLAVDAVVLSHLHPDHCLDLCPFAAHRRWGVPQRPPPVPVHGPAGTADRLAAAYGPADRPGLDDVFTFSTFPAGERELGPFRLRVARVAHPGQAYAVRLSAGGSTLAYSGDTGPCAALTELARDADVLLSEASFLPGAGNPPDLHLTGRQAGEHAAAAGVGRLLVTHVPPWSDPDRALAEAAAAAPGLPASLVAAGACYDL